jgi:hypothetical protein
MTPLETAIAHMTAILSECPTFFRAFRQYFEHQAAEKAKEDPHEYGQLPMMLAAEVTRLRAKFRSSTQPPKPESSTKP